MKGRFFHCCEKYLPHLALTCLVSTTQRRSCAVVRVGEFCAAPAGQAGASVLPALLAERGCCLQGGAASPFGAVGLCPV